MDTSTWLCGPPTSYGQRQQYPSRFLFNLKRTYQIDGKRILSMFSGASNLGITTDFREDSGADYICDYESIPLPNKSFDIIIADPPYTCGFSNEWTCHPKEMPKPKRILREASRLVVDGGMIFILHVIIIPAYSELRVERVALHPILCGPNNAIRVLNVFRRKEDGKKENSVQSTCENVSSSNVAVLEKS